MKEIEIKHQNTELDLDSNPIFISPSSIELFISNPDTWWKERVNKERSFFGSLPSVKGTAIHSMFEVVSNNLEDVMANPETATILYNEVLEPIFISQLDEAVIDSVITETESNDLMEELPVYYNKVIQFLITDSCKIVNAESKFLYHHRPKANIAVYNSFIIRGVIDAIVVDSEGRYGIRDYKYSGKKPSFTNGKYLPQFYTYVLALEKMSPELKIEFVELVGVWELKRTGVQVLSTKVEVDRSKVKAIESIIDTIIESHQVAVKYPQIQHLLFRKGVGFMGKVDLEEFVK